MVKVLVSDPISEKAIEGLKNLGCDVSVKTGMDKEELMNTIGEFEVIVVRSATKLREDVLSKAKNLKLIIRGGVGLDNIDLEAAKKLGITVKNTPSASAISVAELAIGMMFALSRKLSEADRSMKEGKWEKKKFKGTELYGKILGVIGLGNIGIEVCKRATCLGMKVLGYDVVKKENLPEGVTQVNMDELLSNSHIITLHVPFIKEVGAVIGEKEFEKMKDGIILINCARGGVVDEKALLKYLKNGKIKAAGIDVYETEPPTFREFIEMDNCICTPHIGASTKEGQDRVGDEIVKIVEEYIS